MPADSNSDTADYNPDFVVGNSPELMPLDCSLFADLNYALQFHHALFTTSMTDKNPLKFSMSTPYRAT